MEDEVLQFLVQSQARQQLPASLESWDRALEVEGESGAPAGEYHLVHLAALVQRTRTLSRLLGDEYAETAAVALETLLTLAIDGEVTYETRKIRSAARFGCEALRRSIRSQMELCSQPPPYPPLPEDERRQLVEAVHHILYAIDEIPMVSAYGGPCVAFPVRHTGSDHAPMRLRGFDLYRMEMENLHLFLMEMPWDMVEERPNGMAGLLDYAARNGHVFDTRAARSPSRAATSVLRVLYGSTLEADFLEVIFQAPSENIHLIDPLLVRRYSPSWSIAPEQEKAPVLSHSARKSVQELVDEYTVALNKMFAAARTAPREELPDIIF